MYRETNLRSIVKGISWRVFGSTVTILIVYVFFGELKLAVFAGLLEFLSKVILYWVHERIWQRIGWGVVENTGGDAKDDETNELS